VSFNQLRFYIWLYLFTPAKQRGCQHLKFFSQFTQLLDAQWNTFLTAKHQSLSPLLCFAQPEHSSPRRSQLFHGENIGVGVCARSFHELPGRQGLASQSGAKTETRRRNASAPRLRRMNYELLLNCG
jgi:hypothetical protein